MIQEELKQLLEYNSDTGIFTWNVQKSKRLRIGDIAGYLDITGYRRIGINRELYLAHRLAWFYVTGEWPKDQIDHINHQRDDNRFSNLREVNNSNNQTNRSLSKKSTSKVLGVTWHKKNKRWQAGIAIRGKNKYLGSFLNMEDAIKVRKKAEIDFKFHENHGK